MINYQDNLIKIVCISCSEINGMTVCYKMGNVQDTANNSDSTGNTNSKTSSDPVFPHARSPPNVPPRPAPPVPGASPYPKLDGGDNDYEILLPNYPSRPAPRPPATRQFSTLTVFNGLEGVPFVLNPSFQPGAREVVRFYC